MVIFWVLLLNWNIVVLKLFYICSFVNNNKGYIIFKKNIFLVENVLLRRGFKSILRGICD